VPFEVEWQQIVDIGVVLALRQFSEDMAYPRERLKAAGSAC